jgi:hypothetical protein
MAHSQSASTSAVVTNGGDHDINDTEQRDTVSAMKGVPCLPDPDLELEEKLRRLTMVKHPSLGQGPYSKSMDHGENGHTGHDDDEVFDSTKRQLDLLKPRYVIENGIVRKVSFRLTIFTPYQCIEIFVHIKLSS